MSGIRETLIAAVAAQMETIKIANGYSTDVSKVFRIDFLPDQLDDTDFPAVYVLEPLNGGTLKVMDANAYQYNLPLLLSGMVRANTTDLKTSDRATSLNALINDIWKACLLDPTFTKTCKQSWLKDGPGYISPDDGTALYNCELECLMVFQRSDL